MNDKNPFGVRPDYRAPNDGKRKLDDHIFSEMERSKEREFSKNLMRVMYSNIITPNSKIHFLPPSSVKIYSGRGMTKALRHFDEPMDMYPSGTPKLNIRKDGKGANYHYDASPEYRDDNKDLDGGVEYGDPQPRGDGKNSSDDNEVF